MFLDFFLLAVLASPVQTAVYKERPNSCSPDEFTCGDGACVSLDRVCDNRYDCADLSDESACYTSLDKIPFGDHVLSRSKRQSQCRKSQWQCRDGTCIGFDGKCDGVVDCPDRSDETHALCRKTQCQSNWFRCTYGACVDGTAPCNGVQECADNSDELLPRCRNETDEVRGKFRCLSGESIPASSHCDGARDCADGSDETVRACAGKACASYLFQCAYGACVDQGSDCNGAQECADGSDEADELCNKISPGTKPTPVAPTTGNCVLPPYPEHGRYTVAGAPNSSPGQRFPAFVINVTCNAGYGVDGSSVLYCQDGGWSGEMSKCIRYCQLKPHPSVRYRCQVRNERDGFVGERDCNEQEPSNTIVIPRCNEPNYYYPKALNYMRCIEGNWDYVAICQPECGRVTPSGEQLIIDGEVAQRGELPWHAGIYRKTTKPYMQICGGSLVSNNVVISAAHCFWDKLEEKQQPASMFAVGVGKLYRPWNDPNDDAQKADVSELKLPPRFLGATANFQEDIAILVLSISFQYKPYVRPVCLDFDINFDRRQLSDGNLGKVAGWGLTAENGGASPVLKVVSLPYVSVQECLTNSPNGFREYITSDKICAGWGNGTALCKGDSGGGLVFPESDRGIERFYLRGIVSTAPNNDNLCNAFTLTTFTQISKHEDFIKQYVSI